MKAQSLSHTAWDCKYHIVWIPKYRRKSLYKELRQYVGPLLRDLAGQKECKIEEGHLMVDHVHIMMSIPPKYSVAQIVGFVKGKVQHRLLETTWGAGKTSRAKSFGREDTMCLQSEGMKR
jgi:REP-associated tyrosine transposase